MDLYGFCRFCLASLRGYSTGTLIQAVMRMMTGIFFSFPAGWRRQILEIVLELELVLDR
jgi:hypothetical protein